MSLSFTLLFDLILKQNKKLPASWRQAKLSISFFPPLPYSLFFFVVFFLLFGVFYLVFWICFQCFKLNIHFRNLVKSVCQ